MANTLTRTEAGLELPAAGTYEIDPTHSSVSFQVRHLGLSKVRGSFERFSGSLTIGEDPAASTARVDIESASFTTGAEDRDQHVRSADFLDVDNYASLRFETAGVRQEGDHWQLDGNLTVKDRAVPVTIDVRFEGAGQDPWGNGRIAFTGETEINREDFGITWNQALEAGGVLVGKNVKIFIDVQAVAKG